ncbi:MAG: methyl-accepting chemotaxis protein [Candidatus Omnitrophica bacterium]|nr:methyl-accepting chemotaxis protein [Candidatus Omnitrophota bacterium]MDD5488349.1 methyl-accepting chemotaxis protein [Candidatus Omnitrophota bacterium]
MNDSTQNRRKNYFIDKSFQSRFITKFCVIIVIASVLIGLFTYFLNQQTTTVAFENLKVVVKTTADFILPTVIWILIIVTVFTAVMTIAVTLFTSHRISGPLFRLQKELERIKSGDLRGSIHIRAKDQLKKTAAEFDELRVELQRSLGTIKSDWEEVKRGLGSADTGKISDNIGRIDSELSKYKI